MLRIICVVHEQHNVLFIYIIWDNLAGGKIIVGGIGCWLAGLVSFFLLLQIEMLKQNLNGNLRFYYLKFFHMACRSYVLQSTGDCYLLTAWLASFCRHYCCCWLLLLRLIQQLDMSF